MSLDHHTVYKLRDLTSELVMAGNDRSLVQSISDNFIILTLNSLNIHSNCSQLIVRLLHLYSWDLDDR